MSSRSERFPASLKQMRKWWPNAVDLIQFRIDGPDGRRIEYQGSSLGEAFKVLDSYCQSVHGASIRNVP